MEKSAFPGRGGLLQLAHGAAGRRNRSQPFPGRTGRISVGEKRDDFGGSLSGRRARRPAAPHLPDFRQRRPGIPAFELGSAGRAVRCRRVVGSDGPRPGGKTSLRGRHRPSPLDARRWKSGFPAPGRIGREVGPAGSGVDGPGVYFIFRYYFKTILTLCPANSPAGSGTLRETPFNFSVNEECLPVGSAA